MASEPQEYYQSSIGIQGVPATVTGIKKSTKDIDEAELMARYMKELQHSGDTADLIESIREIYGQGHCFYRPPIEIEAKTYPAETEASGPDIIVHFPPKRRYTVKGRIKTRRRGEPTIIGWE